MGIIRIKEENMPQSAWEVRITEEAIKGKDGNIGGAVVTVTRTKPSNKIPVNRLHLAVRDQNKDDGCGTKIQDKEGSSFYGWLEGKVCKKISRLSWRECMKY